MRIKSIFLFATICVSALFTSCGSGKTNQEKSEEVQDTIIVPQRDIKYGVDITDLTMQSGKVKSNQVISSLFNELGAPKNVINQLSLIPDTVFDVRLLKAGNSYEAFYTVDSLPQLQYLVYMDTKIKCVVFHVQDSFYVERFNKPVVSQTKVSEVTIESSLWNAIVDANLNIELAVKLSDIYAWTVDFFGLQKGDGFKVYYDESYVDSSSVGISAIHASVFRHNDKNVYAIEYEKDGRSAYWDLEGNSVKKAFLKAPLSFSRISSGFTYARKHPVYKTVRPHTGVDYAAPMGTPVMSIGDGVVISKGYQGGGGHTVKIKHNSTYTTAYLHLSKYGAGVQVGARVAQGQVIGYVGSTGASTGPHLDFRIWKNGQPIDPLKMDSPPTEPIPDSLKVQFDSVKVEMLKILGVEDASAEVVNLDSVQ